MFEEAIRMKVFPGAVLGVAFGAKGQRKIHVQPFGHTSYAQEKRVDEQTVYDLASLTKPLATTISLLCLLKEREIKLSDRLDKFFPGQIPGPKKKITLSSLLSHSAGFPAHRPYFQKIMKEKEKKETLFSLLMAETLVYEPGTMSLYSDLGFMLLGLIIEKTSGMNQDVFFREKVSDPLEISEKIFYSAAVPGQGKKVENYAFMEVCPLRQRVLRAEVSDENAYALGGVSGHAGLFGSMEGVLPLAVHLLDQWQGREDHPGYRSRDLREFLQKQNISGSTWALGFDTPSATGSSGGKYLSPASIGHLGFTGTSFWIDPVRELVMVLLSNRVHPSRENERIKKFRPLLHDAVIENLGLV